MTDVRFLAPAEEEMETSAQYYEQQLPGLGYRFLNEIDRGVRAIKTLPKAAPVIHPNIRRKLLRHFPYALLYRIAPTEIVILAVMHLRRKPGYWLNRDDHEPC